MCSFWSSSGIRLCKRKDEIDELLKILNVRGCQTSVPRSSFLTVQSLSKSVRSWLAALQSATDIIAKAGRFRSCCLWKNLTTLGSFSAGIADAISETSAWVLTWQRFRRVRLCRKCWDARIMTVEGILTKSSGIKNSRRGRKRWRSAWCSKVHVGLCRMKAECWRWKTLFCSGSNRSNMHFSVIVFRKSSFLIWTWVIIRRSVISWIASSLIGSVRRVMIVRRSRICRIVWAVCFSREMFVQQLSNVFSRLNIIYICFRSKTHFGERVELRRSSGHCSISRVHILSGGIAVVVMIICILIVECRISWVATAHCCPRGAVAWFYLGRWKSLNRGGWMLNLDRPAS